MSKIIKGTDKTSVTPDYELKTVDAPVIKGSVYDASAEARRIIERAREQAAKIIADAQPEIDAKWAEIEQERRNLQLERERIEEERRKILEKSREEGYREGFAKVNEIIYELTEKKREVLAQAEADMIRLSIRVAARIIGRELRQHPDTIADIVTQAIQTVRNQTKIIIRVNPDDMEHLLKSKDLLLARVGQSKIIDFQSDPKVQPGGCVIESEAGTVNAQLKTQLEVMEKMLLKRAGHLR
ncbi:MAG: FliH/SctL family protein [Acidobacteriota bacterium]|nr:FliH/SctL family protein [Blastocatellia bacterium]MDW8411882.1 FliH/SctL family protein [Acidobacteriota bacterium]